MKRFALSLVMLIGMSSLFGCIVINTQKESKTGFTTSCAGEGEHVNDGVFVHLSSGPEDPHRALMALKMATLMAETRDVCVYVDIKGVNLLTKDAPVLQKEPFPSSHEMIMDLVAKGVPVMACPACLKAAGLSPDNLMPGIKVADKDTFFSFTDGRILTIDY